MPTAIATRFFLVFRGSFFAKKISPPIPDKPARHRLSHALWLLRGTILYPAIRHISFRDDEYGRPPQAAPRLHRTTSPRLSVPPVHCIFYRRARRPTVLFLLGKREKPL